MRPITRRQSSCWTWRYNACGASAGVCPRRSASKPSRWPRSSRTAEALAAREDERSRTITELFPEEVEPDPLYENDDDFWQSHELEYPKNSQVFSGTVDRAREDVAEEDEFVGWLAPREREVLLMHEVHGVPLQEVAPAVGITPAEAEGLLASARRRVRAADKAAH